MPRLLLLLSAMATCCIVSAQTGSRQQLLEAWRLFKNQEFAEALTAAELLLGDPYAGADAYKLSGVCLARLGRGHEAELRFVKAAELLPRDAMNWFYLGFARLRQFKYDDAIAPLRRSIELAPAHADAYYNLGIALEQSHKLDDAETLYRQMAARLGSRPPEGGKPQLFLGRMLVHQGRHEEAVTWLQAAVAHLPKSDEGWKFLGRAYRQTGRDQDAVKALKTSLEIRAEDRETRYLLMRAYLALGLNDMAQEQAKLIEALEAKRIER